MSLTLILLILLKLAVAGIIVAIGLDSAPGDVVYLWRRPRLLLRWRRATASASTP